MGHNRHSNECKARFDAIFSRRGESAGPTPKPVADGEEAESVRQGQMMKELRLPLSLDSSRDLRFSRAKTRLRPSKRSLTV